jgi:hypothetical protein
MIDDDDLPLFESPLLLVSTAKEDIANFRKECGAFAQSCKYELIKEYDSKSDHEVYKFRVDKRVPGKLRMQFSRIVNELRHSLDQVMCDGAKALGAANVKNLYFPFGQDKAGFDDKIKDCRRKVNAELCDFVAQFNAYSGGDSLLWSLTRLAAMKHQRILALGPDWHTIRAGGPNLTMSGPVIIGINKWNERRNELEFARIGPGGRLEINVQLITEVAIGKADIVGGQSVLSTLDQYAAKVESIVLGIEAESKRIASATR